MPFHCLANKDQSTQQSGPAHVSGFTWHHLFPRSSISAVFQQLKLANPHLPQGLCLWSSLPTHPYLHLLAQLTLFQSSNLPTNITSLRPPLPLALHSQSYQNFPLKHLSWLLIKSPVWLYQLHEAGAILLWNLFYCWSMLWNKLIFVK